MNKEVSDLEGSGTLNLELRENIKEEVKSDQANNE